MLYKITIGNNLTVVSPPPALTFACGCIAAVHARPLPKTKVHERLSGTSVAGLSINREHSNKTTKPKFH